VTDARAAAWLTAWDCLVQADECRKKALGEGRPKPEISELYRDEMQRLQRQAELFTALIHAPAEVGLIAGVELERRRDAEREQAAMAKDLADKFRESDEGNTQ